MPGLNELLNYIDKHTCKSIFELYDAFGCDIYYKDTFSREHFIDAALKKGEKEVAKLLLSGMYSDIDIAFSDEELTFAWHVAVHDAAVNNKLSTVFIDIHTEFYNRKYIKDGMIYIIPVDKDLIEAIKKNRNKIVERMTR